MRTRYWDDKGPPPKALRIIMGYLDRVAHPVFLGFISVEVGYNLRQTEEMMQHLQDQGLVRPLTLAEKMKLGYSTDVDAEVWCRNTPVP